MPFNNLCIQNTWKKGSGPLFESFNPATGKVLWKGSSAGVDDVAKACKAAFQAFETWSICPINERIEYLHSFRDELETEKDSLALLIAQETGKPLWESKGEVESMVAKIAHSISAYHERCPNKTIPKSNQVIKTFHKPHGIAAVLGPFNFPGHLPNGHIVPALLAGNTVIFKPSELTPAVGEALMRIWQKSGLPKGVLNLLQGGKDTGSLLIEHAAVNAVFFTGSWETGKRFLEKLASHPEKILALEMGGNNPLVIDSIKDQRSAAHLTIQSAFITAGQRCSCARRLIVLEGTAGDAFIAELAEMTENILVGAYDTSPEPFMGPVIHLKAAQKLLKKQEELMQLGGKPLLMMKQLPPDSSFITPGIMNVEEIKQMPDEEIFGPFLQLSRAKNLHEAVKKANQTTYGLCAGIFSDIPEHFDFFYQHVRAGVINWNAPTTGASSAAPFGGIGKSGNHRPNAYYAADYCSYPVASIESNLLQKPLKMPPGIPI